MLSKQLEFCEGNFETILPLDMFYEGTILHNFEIRFSQLAHFTRKLFEAAWPVLGLFLDMYNLHEVLNASRCWMSHHRWRDRRPFLTGLSRD